jgi:hypothetical protein
MDDLKVDYLVLMDDEGAFCDCKDSFNRLLQVSSDIKIISNKIRYKDDLELDYSVSCGVVEGKSQRFFQISFSGKCSDEKIEVFVSMLKEVRTIIHKSGGQPEVLRDDISTYYSQQAYPLIHRIENLMRKLIANFMLRKVGKGWLKETSPDAFKQALEKSKRRESGYMNALYQVDFIHLADFLFKPYCVNEISKLYEQLDKASSSEDLKLDELKEFIPRSNWHRYFSSVVDCDDLFLDKRWKELYELRCMVAHNSIMTKQDLTKTVKLIDEIEDKIIKAIDDIDKITVPADAKEIVAESVMENINSLYGEFIRTWKKLESTARSLAMMFDLHTRIAVSMDGTNRKVIVPSHILYRSFHKRKILSEDVVNKIMYLQHFRNQLMHADEVMSKADIEPNISLCDECILQINEAIEMLSCRTVNVWLDEDVPEYMSGIIRVGRVVVLEGDEETDRQDLVNNIEFSDMDSMLKYIAQEVTVPEANIQVMHEGER